MHNGQYHVERLLLLPQHQLFVSLTANCGQLVFFIKVYVFCSCRYNLVLYYCCWFCYVIFVSICVFVLNQIRLVIKVCCKYKKQTLQVIV